MEFGIVQFTSDRGLAPYKVARLVEEAGFASYFVPEHSHIPTKREAAHPGTGDSSLPDDRYLRTLDPWVSLGGAAAVTERIRLATAVALPVQSDPLTLAKQLATLDHLSAGRLTLGVGFGWNLDELADHGVPPKRRRTMLREYLEAMTALWRDEVAEYDGEFVKFGPSWSWPKTVQQPRPPILVGAGGTEKNFTWIAKNADGWISTPRDTGVEDSVVELQRIWRDHGRDGDPHVTLLDGRPDAERLARWKELGVSEVLYGLPDDDEDVARGYLAKLAGKLGLS
ncbi:LLM class F420-dependent oxidoreductase [Jongsikchunia kroppenstedtii]|uniref:LLM class F420-dependent oxidoreductase n=1 Tax=Jongsikchunia kroppenstedtii TaxID=1121721 RepID=UPI0003641F4B|nr:LLM class F420-dependent oxidoreductase [Jongsikchunia kroppenstedtii]